MNIRFGFLMMFFLLCVACSPSTPSISYIETAIAQTLTAQPSPTQYQIIATETQVDTATPTSTIQPTFTKTSTPRPTSTPLPTATPYVARWLESVDDPISKMAVDKDEFTGITWYSDKTSSRYRNVSGFYLIFGQYSVTKTLWLVIQYTGSHWLFIKSYSISVDGKIYTITPGYFEVERDLGGGTIWEWYQLQVSKADVEMIESIIDSKTTVIRFYGDQYSDDRAISDTEKQALKNVLAAFETLGGRLDKP